MTDRARRAGRAAFPARAGMNRARRRVPYADKDAGCRSKISPPSQMKIVVLPVRPKASQSLGNPGLFCRRLTDFDFMTKRKMRWDGPSARRSNGHPGTTRSRRAGGSREATADDAQVVWPRGSWIGSVGGGDGLFPSPGEIKLECSCPDWADMCKHVSAVLYGVGARLDEKPQLLFVLRGVDENELIASAGQDFPLSRATPGAAKVLNDTDVAALFGPEMAYTAGSDGNKAPKRQRPKVSKTPSSDSPTASKQLERSKPLNRSKLPSQTTRPASRKRQRQAAQRITRLAQQARV